MDMFQLVATELGLAVMFGLGLYVGKRGLTGIQMDVTNVKAEVEKLKGTVTPAPVQPASV